MEEQQKVEVYINMPLRDVKEIFLCLCDAAERLDYKGVNDIYARLEKLEQWIDTKNLGPLHDAMERFYMATIPRNEVIS